MKEIITTVGTSLFTNYALQDIKYKLGDEYKSIDNQLEKLKNIPAQDYNEPKYEHYINNIKKVIKERWLNGFEKKDGEWIKTDESKPNYDASAEISSLKKIIENDKSNNYEVVLFVSDTILSLLATNVLEQFIKEIFSNISNIRIVIINNLRIDNLDTFKNGLVKLVDLLKSEIEKSTNRENIYDRAAIENISKNILMNISGGYKAVIPYLTIISMITKISIYYIFEDSNELIEIPYIPLGFDELFLEDIYFDLQSRNFSDQLVIKKLEQFGLVEKKKDKYHLSAIGEFLKSYIEGQSSQAKNVFGFIVEYKLLEYFFNNPVIINGKQLKSIERSIMVAGKEIDLVMQNNDSKKKLYCFAEVKSIYPFAININKMIDDFQKRINKIETVYRYSAYEYHYYIYHRIEKLNDKTIENRNNVIQKIKEIKFNGKVKFFDVIIPKEENDNFEYQNQYQAYVTSKIKKENINEITL